MENFSLFRGGLIKDRRYLLSVLRDRRTSVAVPYWYLYAAKDYCAHTTLLHVYLPGRIAGVGRIISVNNIWMASISESIGATEVLIP